MESGHHRWGTTSSSVDLQTGLWKSGTLRLANAYILCMDTPPRCAACISTRRGKPLSKATATVWLLICTLFTQTLVKFGCLIRRWVKYGTGGASKLKYISWLREEIINRSKSTQVLIKEQKTKRVRNFIKPSFTLSQKSFFVTAWSSLPHWIIYSWLFVNVTDFLILQSDLRIVGVVLYYNFNLLYHHFCSRNSWFKEHWQSYFTWLWDGAVVQVPVGYISFLKNAEVFLYLCH